MPAAGARKLRVVVAKPERLGVAAVFTPGAPLRDIVDFLRRSAGARTPV